jgi:CubicO group peptidase (beta-lactamase class C family)
MKGPTAVRFASVRDLLQTNVASHAFPCAVVEVGHARDVVWRTSVGRLTYDENAASATEDTVFDLASLTKVIATASLAMRLTDSGLLPLAARVREHCREWRGTDRAHVTLRDLLEHCSGLQGWLPLFESRTGRAEFEHAIADSPLEYVPWTRAIYSDLGFMLLGFILEDVAGAPLDRQFGALQLTGIAYRPDAIVSARSAPTEHDRWRNRLLAGEVHDENASALGGVAAHAGLFGTAAGVGDFARVILRTFVEETCLGRPETMRRFASRSTVPGSSRALGWDTMLATSSCGALLSPRAIGHTGFTGTSLWIDPERDLYVVLLTNRVYPTRENNRIREIRPAVHEAVVRAVDGSWAGR